MKKKTIALALTCIMTLGLFAGCGKSAPTSNQDTTSKTSSKTLKIWSFSNELKTMALAFQKEHPDVKIEYTMIPMTNGEFQTKLKSALQSDDIPDVVSLEAAFVREYVESDYLADLSDLVPLAKDLKTYQFTLDIGTYEEKTKAFSYQATPGAMFYRRSLAKKYFGTDDPVKIQALVSNMTKFEAAAKRIKEKSKGNTYMLCSTGDFSNLFYANRKSPWVVNNKLNIDPMIEKLFDAAKSFRQNGYEAQATQWQEGWYAGMNDSLVDAKGNHKQIFCYLLPTWGLPYVLMPNSTVKEVKTKGSAKSTKVGKDTSGDWACINGPIPYQWGGTWMGALNNSKNIDLAKEFIKFSTLNEQTLKDWALGTYTNKYLKAIDPSIGDEQSQGAGDFVSSQKVVDEIASKFDSAETSKFLSGQNSYKGFAEAAKKINLNLIQASDDAIQRALADPIINYASNKSTKEAAIKQFKDAVKNALPDITVE